MSVEGKASIAIFIDSMLLLSKKEDDYASFYAFVCDYENSTTTDSQLTAEDKRIILTTTSIVRHSVHKPKKKKKPKKNTDMDWTIWIANAVGGTHGANTDMFDAILTAATAGIAQNP